MQLAIKATGEGAKMLSFLALILQPKHEALCEIVREWCEFNNIEFGQIHKFR